VKAFNVRVHGGVPNHFSTGLASKEYEVTFFVPPDISRGANSTQAIYEQNFIFYLMKRTNGNVNQTYREVEDLTERGRSSTMVVCYN